MNNAIFFDFAIPIVLILACGYYAVKLLYYKDITAIRPATKPKLEDEEGYAKQAGYLMIYLGASVFIMLIIESFSKPAGYIWILLALIVYTILWRRMNKKFGA